MSMLMIKICKHTNSETQIHYFQPTGFTKLYTCHIRRVLSTYMLPTLTDKQKVSWHVHLEQFPINNSLYHEKINILKYEFWYKLVALNGKKIRNHHSELKVHYLSRGYRKLIFSTFDSYGTSSTLHLKLVSWELQSPFWISKIKPSLQLKFILKKVKWSCYRPGVGRGIALLFHDRSNRRGWVVSSTPRPHFTPRKHPVPILQEAGWAPGPVWTGGKTRPHRDSIPDCPAHTQSLYRLSYLAHLSLY